MSNFRRQTDKPLRRSPVEEYKLFCKWSIMHSYHDTIIQVDEAGDDSDGVEVPYDRLEPETLRNVISEFVTREWEEIGIYQYSLEEKIEQVMSQLKTGKAKLVFDQLSNSCNIVPTGK